MECERMASLVHASVVCSIVSVLLYLNTLHGELVFDDRVAIVENQDLRHDSPWTNLLWHDFWGDDLRFYKSHKSYRPLCAATFKLNYHLHELEPMGYHLVNVILNAVVTYLYVHLCGMVFKQLWPAVFAGLLFAVHPIHTESAAAVVGRADLLSAIFFLLSVLAYRNAVHEKGWKWMAFTMLLTLCSLLSKEQGITAVAACFGYDIFIKQKMDLNSGLETVIVLLKRPKKLPKMTKQFLVRTVALASFTVLVIITRLLHMKGSPQFSIGDNPGQVLKYPYRQLYYLHLCFINCWLLVNPTKLLHDWRMGAVPLVESLADARHLLTLATFIVFIVIGLQSITRKHSGPRIVAFALTLGIVPFLPASNLLFTVGFVVAERVLYIPSMGFSMLIALGFFNLLHSYKSANHSAIKMILKLTVVYLILIHTAKVMTRNRAWCSGFQLTKEAIKVYRGNGLAYSTLGIELEKQEEFVLAEEAHKFAIQLAPNNSQPFRNYGALLQRQKRYEEAEKAFRKGLYNLGTKRVKKRSRTIETFHALINVVSQNESRLQEAIAICNDVISLKPDVPESFLLKGHLLEKLNKTTAAKKSFEQASHLGPLLTEPYYRLGLLHSKIGQMSAAEDYYNKALAIDPRHGKTVLELGILMATGENKDVSRLLVAHKYLKAVLRADPNITRAQYALALVYFQLQKAPQAENLLHKVLEAEPTHEDARLRLGELYYQEKQYKKGIKVLSKLLEHHHLNEKAASILAASYMQLQLFKQADEMYKRLLTENPQHSEALHGLGLLKLQGKAYKDAAKLFTQVLEVDPTHNAAKKQLHIVQTLLQNIRKATL